MASDYREKIRKLLALAESDNENEAKSALLKARRLMAEHKLTEADIGVGEQKVVDVVTEYTCNKRREPWLVPLGTVIGEHYCCRSYHTYRKGKQTHTVAFIGFEEDVQVCLEIFKYAVDCIRAQTKKIRKELGEWYSPQTIQKQCNGYGMGFVYGVNDAFIEQDMEQAAQAEQTGEPGYELVLQIPKEVNEAVGGMERGEYYNPEKEGAVNGGMKQGYNDGKRWSPERRLKEGDADVGSGRRCLLGAQA